jgi:hypothetical protein
MLYRETNTDCSEILTKNVSTLFGQDVEFVTAKPGGVYSNHWVSFKLKQNVVQWTPPLFPFAKCLFHLSIRFYDQTYRADVNKI